jgi:RNA polymerase sigma-70 factor (ECF subfamily)
MHTEESGTGEDLRTVLGSIIDRNAGRWLRFIVAILKNDADAEDVLQEAVQRVLERNRPLPSEEQARMYLGRAIGNAALEFYNSRKRERVRQVPIREQILRPANILSPYACLEERERSAEKERLLRLAHEGLARLPLKQHEALRLTILESSGLSIRDVGATNGIPYSTLRHRNRQGLRRLRKFIERSLKFRRPSPEDGFAF